MVNKMSLDNLLYEYLATGDKRLADEFLSRIKEGSGETLYPIVETRNVEYLFYKDANGVSLFENIFKNNMTIDNYILYSVIDDIRIVRILIKYNKYDYNSATEDILFSEYENGKLVIEYMYENNLSEYVYYRDIKKHTEIIDYILKYDEKAIEYLDEELLFSNYSEDKLLIEYIFEKNKQKYLPIEKIIFHPEIYEMCRKYDVNLLEKVNEVILCDNVPNKDITILEEMINDGYDFSFKHFNLGKSCEIFYKYGRYDYLALCSVQELLNLADLNDTYLDKLMEVASKNLDKYNISGLYLGNLDSEQLAKAYMIFHKYGVLDYTGYPTYFELLKEDITGQSLIEILYDKCDIETFKSIVGTHNINDIDVFIFLKLKGIEADGLLFSDDNNFERDEYIERSNSKIDKLVIPREYEVKLAELRKVMLEDKKSDPKLVETMIRAYRRLLSENNYYGIKEIDLLIEMKKRNPGFCLMEGGKSEYSVSTDHITLCDTRIGTLHHEVGHALFNILAYAEYPDNYVFYAEELRKDPNFIDKVGEFSKKYYEIKEAIYKRIDEELLVDYENKITPERKAEIEEYLKKTKEEKIEVYKEYGYSEEELKALVEDTFTYEEYIMSEKAIKRHELLRAILDVEFPGLAEISDIIDAICEGKFFDEKLVNSEGDKIYGCLGHGIKYYNEFGLSVQFDEIMANYSAISKSSEPDKILEELRDIVGDKMVDLIKICYETQIVEYRGYEQANTL